MAELLEILSKIEDIVERVPTPPTPQAFDRAIEAFDRETVPVLRAISDIQSQIPHEAMTGALSIKDELEVGDEVHVVNSNELKMYLPEFESLTFEDVLPKEMAFLIGPNGFLTSSVPDPVGAMSAVLSSMEKSAPKLSKALDRGWLDSASGKIKKIEEQLDETLKEMIDSIESVLSEDVIGEISNHADNAIGIMEDIEDVVDGGIGEVLGELSALITILEDVADLFEETEAVWELYAAMP